MSKKDFKFFLDKEGNLGITFNENSYVFEGAKIIQAEVSMRNNPTNLSVSPFGETIVSQGLTETSVELELIAGEIIDSDNSEALNIEEINKVFSRCIDI